MSGAKGKSGGPGRNQGRRAKLDPAKTLALRPQYRQELAIITKRLRGTRNNPKLSQREVVEEFVHAAWLEYDAMIQEMSEKALEGEVL